MNDDTLRGLHVIERELSYSWSIDDLGNSTTPKVTLSPRLTDILNSEPRSLRIAAYVRNDTDWASVTL